MPRTSAASMLTETICTVSATGACAYWRARSPDWAAMTPITSPMLAGGWWARRGEGNCSWRGCV